MWRPVVGWEGFYEVSSHGKVRSLDRTVNSVWRGTSSYEKKIAGRELKLGVNRHGYLAGNLCVSNKRTNFELHTLVCRAFHGDPPMNMQVAHNDGVRTNCHAKNLRWATVRENAADRDLHGNGMAGEGNSRAILTQNEVVAIRLSSLSQRALAREYGVSRGAITGILSGKNWKQTT